MRMSAVVRIVLSLLLVIPMSAQAQSAGEGAVSLPIGAQAPAVELEDLDGNDVQLLDYVQGKPALIEFWATWCELCEALQPQLDEIHASFGDEVNVVAVAVGVAQSVRRVKRHLEDHNPGYTYLWDADGRAVRAFEAATTSIVVILNGAGEVVYTGVGGDQDLVGAVAELVSSR